MAWVDKSLLRDKKFETDKDNKIDKTRSIFHIGDFRHNLPTEELARKYDTKILQKPRLFFEWNDGTKFNPKSKKDV